jgi:hypothetical protein
VFSFSAVCKTTWTTLILLKCIVLELTTLKSLLPYEGALWGNYRKEYITVIRIIYQRKRVRSKLIRMYPKFAQLTYRILWLFRKFAQLAYRIPTFLTTKYAAILPEYTSSPSILVWLELPNLCFLCRVLYIIVCLFVLFILEIGLSVHLRFISGYFQLVFANFHFDPNGNPKVAHHAIISIKIIMNLLRFTKQHWSWRLF